MTPEREETVSMEPFEPLTSSLAPLPIDNVDTDQIIPARYLKVTDKSGLGEGLFSNWRWQDGEPGRPNRDFVLNRPVYSEARILLVGDNFGCGSSREHAAWALLANGFRAVIGPRFADIFRNNALKNGLLAAEIGASEWRRLLELARERPSTTVTVDLEAQTVTTPEETISFAVDPFARRCLLEGIDSFGFLLSHLPAIEAWEAKRPAPVSTVDAGASRSERISEI